MTFILKDFIHPSFKQIQVKDKIRYNNLLNLSTNELKHTILDKLDKKYRKNNLSDITRCYPCLVTPRLFLSKYFHLSDNQILLAPGSDLLINLVLLSFNRTKSIIICNPEYYSYRDYALLNGYKIINADIISTSKEESLITYIKLLMNTSSSIVVLSNPNGVTGLSIQIENMDNIAKICDKHNHLLIIDEAYSAFYKLDHRPLLKNYKNILILKTFSKSHGIAGLRFATAFGQNDLISSIRKTGIENAVSSVSINYFIFLIKHEDRINQIHNDILTAKKIFINFLYDEFPQWEVYKTSTHFCTIDVKDEKTALELIDIFKLKNIIIKFLGYVSQLNTCIRITISEGIYMKNVITIVKDYNLKNIEKKHL